MNKLQYIALAIIIVMTSITSILGVQLKATDLVQVVYINLFVIAAVLLILNTVKYLKCHKIERRYAKLEDDEIEKEIGAAK